MHLQSIKFYILVIPLNFFLPSVGKLTTSFAGCLNFTKSPKKLIVYATLFLMFSHWISIVALNRLLGKSFDAHVIHLMQLESVASSESTISFRLSSGKTFIEINWLIFHMPGRIY